MEKEYDIGPRLQCAIDRTGLSKYRVAQLAEMTYAQLYKMLQGQRRHVSALSVRRLAQALETSTDYLLGLTNEPRPVDSILDHQAPPLVPDDAPQYTDEQRSPSPRTNWQGLF